MIITLDNGQAITVYERQSILPQIQSYIDKEIFELLVEKFGISEQPLSLNGIRIVTNSDEMIGETIKYSNIVNNCDLDNVIIATNEGSLLIANIDGGDECSCTSASCIKSEEQLKYKIFADSDVRNELLLNNIISKEYVDQIKQEREIRLEKEAEERKKKCKKEKYQEYLKLKEEFEGND